MKVIIVGVITLVLMSSCGSAYQVGVGVNPTHGKCKRR